MTALLNVKMPPSMTPRPGEEVIYYRGEIRFRGVFHGYDIHDQLMVKNESGSTTPLADFVSVRLAQPYERSEGCYAKLPATTVVQKASVAEKEKLNRLLNQHIQPGPKYIDLIEEIWSRGYEVFLVGGSVRDAINGDDPNDVDLVSTIPFFFLSSIAEAMFGSLGCSRHARNGFMSIGFNAGNKRSSKGTLVDVKNFFLHAPGTELAEFGADIGFDHKLRDFSCNAIYYDPINEMFIDPCGHGIEDAKQRILNVVNDPNLSHPVHRKAHIAMRMFKFMHRDYQPTKKCLREMKEVYEPLMNSCKPDEIWKLFFRSVLGKVPEKNRSELFWKSKQIMSDAGFEEMWVSYFECHEEKYGSAR